MLHVFDNPINDPAETVRRALSRALVHYYPVAGRLASKDNTIRLACTGDGVVFVAATAACTLEDARFLQAPLVMPLTDLFLLYGGRCRISDPLMMMQVTEFACGGFVVGVTWNHGVADALGLAQFLQAVGELARGVSPAPSVHPVRHGEHLPEIPQLFTALAPFLAGRKHAGFACTDVTIPWSFINRVKAEFAESERSRCSTFEVVAAAIWRCRTRAINAQAGAPAPLVFSANVRSRVGAREGYYGNCILSQLVTAASGVVLDGDFLKVVKLVKRGKDRIPDTLANGGGELDEELVGALCGYGVLVLSSWSGLGLDKVDLGGGAPARVMAHMEMAVLPSCLTCLPCSPRAGGDGVNLMAFCVREEHADKLRAQLAKLR